MVQVQHDVATTLNYLPIDSEPPYSYTYAPPDGQQRTNISMEVHPVVVHDARGKEDEFTIDTSGFQYVKYPSVEKDFTDEEVIQTKYYAEVEELLKKVVGAKRVFIFDHTVRRKPQEGRDPDDPATRGPVERVHVDQTYVASVNRVHHHMKDEAEALLKGRVRIINVWRPIGNPVAHKPLAVSDWRALDSKDLVSTRLIYPDYEGSTFSVRYNPNHRWWYLNGQTPDEVTLIKCFDSREDVARLTPHSAFTDNTSPPDAPHRESIEVRVLVFSD